MHSCSQRELWRSCQPIQRTPFPSHCRQKQCHLPERKSAIKTPAGFPTWSFSHSDPRWADTHPTPTARPSTRVTVKPHLHVPGTWISGFFLSGAWELLLQYNKAFFFFLFSPPNCLSVSQILGSFQNQCRRCQRIKWQVLFTKCPVSLRRLWDCIFKINRWICFSFSPSLFLNKCCALWQHDLAALQYR